MFGSKAKDAQKAASARVDEVLARQRAQREAAEKAARELAARQARQARQARPNSRADKSAKRR